LDELAVFQLRERLLRLTGEVAEHAHHEWQLAHLDRITDLDVVADVHARRAHALELPVNAFGHLDAPGQPVCVVTGVGECGLAWRARRPIAGAPCARAGSCTTTRPYSRPAAQQGRPRVRIVGSGYRPAPRV